MSLQPDPSFAALAEVKAVLWPDKDPLTDNTGWDAILTTLITRASTTLQTRCGREFGTYSDTKTFDAPDPPESVLPVPDLQSITTISVNTYVLSADQWRLLPPNRTALAPYYSAVQRLSGVYAYPWWPRLGAPLGTPAGAIAITGVWGYSLTPPPELVQATVQLVCRIWARTLQHHAPASGVPQVAPSVTLAPLVDRDILDLIAPFRGGARFA